METLDQAAGTAATAPRRAISRIRPWAYRAVLAVAPLWALTRVAGLETNVLAYSPATQLLAFTPYVAALSLAPLTAASVRREWRAAALALVATVVLAACVLPGRSETARSQRRGPAVPRSAF